MRRIFVVFLALALVGGAMTTVYAVSAGKTLEFTKSSQGKVIFSGDVHKKAGQTCKDCHNNDTFPKMKQGTVAITMEQINQGKLCGVCHNGKRAFGPEGNCMRCHIKQ